MDVKYDKGIPIYHELIEDIKSLLINNSVLAVLYINCSRVNKIEKMFGKKLYKEKIQELIMKGSINTVFQPIVRFEDNKVIGYP